MLRPYWGIIAIGMLLLFLSVPGELFPALVWKYVTDDLILHGHSKPTPVLATLFSLNGRIHIDHRVHLLISALVWLFFIYESGEVFGTLSTNLMNRVAQKFIFDLPQPRLSQAPIAEPGLSPAPAHWAT